MFHVGEEIDCDLFSSCPLALTMLHQLRTTRYINRCLNLPRRMEISFLGTVRPILPRALYQNEPKQASYVVNYCELTLKTSPSPVKSKSEQLVTGLAAVVVWFGGDGWGEPHTKSHDGQADGSTSEAVRKTHGNICLVYVSDGND